MSGLRPGARIAVTGNPTPDEVAALVLALDRPAGDGRDPGPRRPAWQQAARLEAVGGASVRSPRDLRQPG
jgi:hypothetical protein